MEKTARLGFQMGEENSPENIKTNHASIFFQVFAATCVWCLIKLGHMGKWYLKRLPDYF